MNGGYIYRYEDENGITRYIGKTKRDVITRAYEHFEQNEWMWKHKWTIYYISVNCDEMLDEAEIRLISGSLNESMYNRLIVPCDNPVHYSQINWHKLCVLSPDEYAKTVKGNQTKCWFEYLNKVKEQTALMDKFWMTPEGIDIKYMALKKHCNIIN